MEASPKLDNSSIDIGTSPSPQNSVEDATHEIAPKQDTNAIGNGKYAPPMNNELSKLISEGGEVVDIIDFLTQALQEERDKETNELTEDQNNIYNFIHKLLSGSKRVATDPALLNKLFAEWIPKLMFIMLPFFALLLKVVYIRRKKLYIEHLVFSLHFHAFSFLFLTFLVLAHQFIAFSRPYLPWLLCYVPIYLIIAMWREYDQGPIRTLLKGLIVGCVYSLIMGICLSASILYGMSQF
ncbi:MAG: hypothetical protein ACI93R_003538 [Flavobacteriales bacterium]